MRVKEFEPNFEHATDRKGLQHTKWTRYEQKFRLKDRDARLMASLPPAQETSQDTAPLFSSFSHSKIYDPPIISQLTTPAQTTLQVMETQPLTLIRSSMDESNPMMPNFRTSAIRN